MKSILKALKEYREKHWDKKLPINEAYKKYVGGMRWFLLKLRFQGWWYELNKKWCRRIYCHKGYHKLTKGMESLQKPKGRKTQVEYIQCRHCNWKFFATIKDKKKYEKINRLTKDNISALVTKSLES